MLRLRQQSRLNPSSPLHAENPGEDPEGDLITAAEWIKRTTVAFLEKKGSEVPRPVIVGEFLRTVSCKRLMKKASPRLRRTFRQMRQWGVELPGGTEALIHWRGLIEELCAQGIFEPLFCVLMKPLKMMFLKDF